MLFQQVYGIDLGTSTVKIYDWKKDTITKEENMIAVRDRDTVFAVGNEAYEMFEKTPENIQVVTPMSNGRISDVLLVEAILHTLLSREHTSMGHRPTIYFSVPMDMTEIEKRAYYSVARRGKLKKCRVYLVEKPIADALALGIPLHRTRGSMIVNMGAQSTEVSVLADGRVIMSRMIPSGGKKFDEAIAAAVRRKKQFSDQYENSKAPENCFDRSGQQPSGGKKGDGHRHGNRPSQRWNRHIAYRDGNSPGAGIQNSG